MAETHEGAGVHRGDDRKRAQAGQDSGMGGGGDFVVYGDNSSAITIIGSADGPWRTRHLRLRAEVLREKVKGWAVRHLPGTRLVADHLTKAMTAKAQWPKFYELAGMVKVDVEKVEASSTEWLSTENVNKLKLAGLGLIMGKVASWSPENCQEKEAKTLCLAALGVGVAYVATQITRGHCLKKITKEGRRSPREDEPGAGEMSSRVPEPAQRGKGLKSLNQAPQWRAQGTMNLGSRIRCLGNMNQAQERPNWVEFLGPGQRIGDPVKVFPPSRFNHCPEGCPVGAEGFVNRQPWPLDGGGAELLKRVEKLSVEEEPEDFWDVQTGESMVVLTRVHMLPRHRDYQPQALDLPPGVSLERLEQRRQTSVVYEDVNMGRRLINDQWTEDSFRFRGAWRGATTFWMPLRQETAVARTSEQPRQVRPRLQALRAPEVCILPSGEQPPRLLDDAGGGLPGHGWNPSMEEEREGHWEVEFREDGLVVATRVHEVERI